MSARRANLSLFRVFFPFPIQKKIYFQRKKALNYICTYLALICRSRSVVCVAHALWMCRTHFSQTKISKRMCPSPTIVTRTIEIATEVKHNHTIPHLRVTCPHDGCDGYDCVANVFHLPIAPQSRFSFRYSFSFCLKQNSRNDQTEVWWKN